MREASPQTEMLAPSDPLPKLRSVLEHPILDLHLVILIAREGSTEARQMPIEAKILQDLCDQILIVLRNYSTGVAGFVLQA